MGSLPPIWVPRAQSSQAHKESFDQRWFTPAPITGVLYVRTQWRQVQISPGAEGEDRATAANQ
jgi:hypothetical protein